MLLYKELCLSDKIRTVYILKRREICQQSDYSSCLIKNHAFLLFYCSLLWIVSRHITSIKIHVVVILIIIILVVRSVYISFCMCVCLCVEVFEYPHIVSVFVRWICVTPCITISSAVLLGVVCMTKFAYPNFVASILINI